MKKKKNMSNQINEIKQNFKKIMNEIKTINSEIKNLLTNLKNIKKYCKDFIKEIDRYIQRLPLTTNNNETKRDNTKQIKVFIQNFNDEFEKYINIFKETYDKNYMEKIYDLNNHIKKVKDIIDLKFFPLKCENMNISIKQFSMLEYESQNPFNNNFVESFDNLTIIN